MPSSSLSRAPSRQSSTCSNLAPGTRLLGLHPRSRSSVGSTPCLSRDNSRNSNPDPRHLQPGPEAGYAIHSLVNKDSGKREAVMNDTYKKCVGNPQVTVINADNDQPNPGGKPGGNLLGARSIISGAPSPRQLSRQGSSLESTALHTHTVECAGGARLHQPQLPSHSRGSPTSAECDFHCCSLHAGQSTHKHVATSPIQVREGFCYSFPHTHTIYNLLINTTRKTPIFLKIRIETLHWTRSYFFLPQSAIFLKNENLII